MKKRISLLVALCICITTICTPFSAAAAYDPGFDPISQGVYLVNMDTDTVIYEKNKDTQFVPASLTKVMTAIVALESVPSEEIPTFLQTQVTAPSYIFDELYGLNASTADIRPGETLTMQDLLYALLLASACEAASIIADYVSGGDIDAFVQKMNDKAKELGANNTVFVDPHGLDEQTQRSTAYDMYLITSYAMQNPTFAQIATSQNYTMAATNKHSETRRIQHTNHMMSKYLGGSYYDSRVKGIKTGTATGIKNLVSMAEEDNYHYMLVLMGASTAQNTTPTYEDASNLYDWAFDNFSFKTVAEPGEKMIPNNVKVENGKDTDAVVLTPKSQVVELLPSNIDPSSIMWDVSRLPQTVNAPIHQGDEIGEVDLRLADEVIQTVTVVAAQDVSLSLSAFIWNGVTYVVTSWWLLLILALLVCIAIAYFVLVVRYNRRKKAKRHRRR